MSASFLNNSGRSFFKQNSGLKWKNSVITMLFHSASKMKTIALSVK